MSVYKPEVGDFLIKLDETHSGRDAWLYVTESSIDERQHQVESGEYGLALPILGYSTRLSPTSQSEIVKEIMNDEDVRLTDFRNPSMKSLDAPGGLHLAAIALPTRARPSCAQPFFFRSSSPFSRTAQLQTLPCARPTATLSCLTFNIIIRLWPKVNS